MLRLPQQMHEGEIDRISIFNADLQKEMSRLRIPVSNSTRCSEPCFKKRAPDAHRGAGKE